MPVQFFFLWLVNKRIVNRKRFKGLGWLFTVVIFVNVLFVNLTHSWAYAQNYMPITSLSGHVPFYFPMHSKSIAKSDVLDGMAGNDQQFDSSNINYPKSQMQCSMADDSKPNIIMVVLESWRADTMDQEVSPNTYQLAQESLWFKDHHSSGSVTTRGIFSLMYGIAPTYMDNVVAHNGAGGPVLLNELKEKFGFTYIFISHDLAVVKYMSDQLLVMNQGKIEELDDADAIYESPKKEYTKKLIEAIAKYNKNH